MSGSVPKIQQDWIDMGNDINYTLDALRRGSSGDFAKGVASQARHQTSVHELLPQYDIWGTKSQAREKRLADEARNEAANQESALIQAAQADRAAKITTRLNEAVRLRQKQPGRGQTILTETLIGPNAGNPDTLLTTSARR